MQNSTANYEGNNKYTPTKCNKDKKMNQQKG